MTTLTENKILALTRPVDFPDGSRADRNTLVTCIRHEEARETTRERYLVRFPTGEERYLDPSWVREQ